MKEVRSLASAESVGAKSVLSMRALAKNAVNARYLDKMLKENSECAPLE